MFLTVATIGWGRKLSYCIAFSVDGATDVTRRYVRDFAAYGGSRDRAPEEVLMYILRDIRTSRRARLDEQGKSRLVEEDLREEEELQMYIAGRITQHIIDRPMAISPESTSNDLSIKRPPGMSLPIPSKSERLKLSHYSQVPLNESYHEIKMSSQVESQEGTIILRHMKIHIISHRSASTNSIYGD